MENTKEHKIRPYARLLTMLGEQLITDERIALVEIIKNSYDADADWVKVTFQGFGDKFTTNKDSKIIIEDNGHGMTLSVIEKAWLNPATPVKLNLKSNEKYTTTKGRIIQGEKGIGRFALLKLGKKIRVITRPKDNNQEYVIDYDFSKYDDNFLNEYKDDTLNEKENNEELFLDNLSVTVTERIPEYFIEKNISLGVKKRRADIFGAYIEISYIKGVWTDKKVEKIFNDTRKLTSIFGVSEKTDFDIYFYRNEQYLPFQQEFIKNLNTLIENNAVLSIKDGKFDETRMIFSYFINDKKEEISITDSNITGLRVFRTRFGDGAAILKERKIECGSFGFEFYIFDLRAAAKVSPKYQLNKNDKEIIKAHRIYLYRDDVRVYPYGEPDDDWLQIDIYRGIISAGDFLSNDQVVGSVKITQRGNPKLKDKTDREGLVNEENATDDLIALLQTFLAYIRKRHYAQYLIESDRRENYDKLKKEQVKSDFEELKAAIGNNTKLLKKIDRVEKDYAIEKAHLLKRAETTEDLAGVGLSVETASHDIMSMMSKVLANIDALITDLHTGADIDMDQLLKELQSIRGGMSFIEAQLKDIQLLFRSSKQRRRNIRVIDIIEKVKRIYKKLMVKEHIQFSVEAIGSPLVAKTTDAVLLQLLLNLFDNSIYWLKQVSNTPKTITIFLDGDQGKMIFSDNGPGVHHDDIPYIFDSFYSGKGEEGRGLGLYIARQLLERQDFSIDLADLPSGKKLSGANFIVTFVKGEEK
jgi:signal transduction histidine kinase